MSASTADHSHLAASYLALGDDLEPAPSQRSFPRALCALVAGLVLALAVPLAWAAKPHDLPAATATGKAGGVVADDDDPDDGDGPGDGDGQTWAATIA